MFSIPEVTHYWEKNYFCIEYRLLSFYQKKNKIELILMSLPLSSSCTILLLHGNKTAAGEWNNDLCVVFVRTFFLNVTDMLLGLLADLAHSSIWWLLGKLHPPFTVTSIAAVWFTVSLLLTACVCAHLGCLAFHWAEAWCNKAQNRFISIRDGWLGNEWWKKGQVSAV